MYRSFDTVKLCIIFCSGGSCSTERRITDFCAAGAENTSGAGHTAYISVADRDAGPYGDSLADAISGSHADHHSDTVACAEHYYLPSVTPAPTTVSAPVTIPVLPPPNRMVRGGSATSNTYRCAYINAHSDSDPTAQATEEPTVFYSQTPFGFC